MTVTAGVPLTVTRTRPVTTCRLCNEPIGDQLVTMGYVVSVGPEGRWDTEMVMHPECYDDDDRTPSWLRSSALGDESWSTCPWCERRWVLVSTKARPPGRQSPYSLCTDACRKAARRARRRPSERQCEECGQRFAPARVDARYCSSACRQRSYRARRSP